MSGYLYRVGSTATKLHAEDVEEQVFQEVLSLPGPALSMHEMQMKAKELTEKLWSELGEHEKTEYFKRAQKKMMEHSAEIQSAKREAAVQQKEDKTADDDEELKKSDEPAKDDE